MVVKCLLANFAVEYERNSGRAAAWELIIIMFHSILLLYLKTKLQHLPLYLCVKSL